MFGSKQLRISFREVNGFTRVYDGIRFLVLFAPPAQKKHDAIYNRIRYQKSGITYVFFHNYAKIKDDPYDSLPLEKNAEFA